MTTSTFLATVINALGTAGIAMILMVSSVVITATIFDQVVKTLSN